MVSSTVDIPTISAPHVAAMRISAGVSKCGPCSPKYTASLIPGSTARTSARNDSLYASVRSTKRPASGAGALSPVSGECAVRLMWSRMTTGVPTFQLVRKQPAPLVSKTVRQPSANAVRTPCTTAWTPRPSYKCVRPVSSSTGVVPMQMDFSAPP